VPVSFIIQNGATLTGYKIIGINDLGMHCFDGPDYSVFGLLPPSNNIRAHAIDPNGLLIRSAAGFTVDYKGITDPLKRSLNTTSIGKTNFWQYAQALGFGVLNPDVGIRGFAMPGSKNMPQAMPFDSTTNLWHAEGIPITPFADNGTQNFFPMMRLTLTGASGPLVTGDIVLPVSTELSCSICHASNSGNAAALPAAGGVNNPDPAKDTKLNILRKHDERFVSLPTFQTAAANVGYSAAGLAATVPTRPVSCNFCHADNALQRGGQPGVPALTRSIHGIHANVVDPSTNAILDAGTTRNTCYLCHPGPKTQCDRGAMADLVDTTGTHIIECQSCHSKMTAISNPARRGWFDLPNCQACHNGTATTNNGQIIYTSALDATGALRAPADSRYATNPNTPAPGFSLYRFSTGHGGIQCEICHGSPHAEQPTTIVNDNVQATALQGDSGTLVECTACHLSVPNTITGAPHGIHPVGTSWITTHQSVVLANGPTQCQVCHGTDYRGTVISKTYASRSLAGRNFRQGTVISCFSCHNGPTGAPFLDE
jgi:hypothetical protein